MSFYSGALRFLVHLLGIVMVLGGIVGGWISMGVLGMVLGFGGSLLAAGFLLGTIALFFEIRDKLETIELALTAGVPAGQGRREPTM
jgi:hypothetical protein